jgi:hypothetical protein
LRDRFGSAEAEAVGAAGLGDLERGDGLVGGEGDAEVGVGVATGGGGAIDEARFGDGVPGPAGHVGDKWSAARAEAGAPGAVGVVEPFIDEGSGEDGGLGRRSEGEQEECFFIS